MLLFFYFLNYPCNIKIPKNKSSPNAPKVEYDFFLEYLRISGTENTAGEQAPGHEGPGRAPCLVGPWRPPSTYSSNHTLLLPPKKITNQLKYEF